MFRNCLFILLISSISISSNSDPVAEFKRIYEQEWDFRLQENPEFASGNGIEGHADRLTQVNEAALARRAEYWRGILKQLEAIDCAALGRQQCINYRIYKRQIESSVANYELNAHLVPFNSDWGFYISWARMPDITEFNNAKDYTDYLSRLSQLPQVMDEYIGLMRKGLAMGMTQPKVVLQGRDLPIQQQVVETAEESAFFKPFASLPDWLSAAEQKSLQASARKQIEQNVIPAFDKLLQFMRKEYALKAREELGAGRLPNGKAFYQQQIRDYATVEMSPDEIHQIGLSEVARIRAEMDAIIKQLEFDGSFSDFIDFLRNDPQFYAETPRQLLAEAAYWTKKMDGRLPSLFGHLPRQPYGVAPVPDEIAPFFTAGRYVGAPLDASRGGYYWVNTHDLKNRPLYTLPALTLHEAAPGHHLQIALAAEQDEQPPFRRYDYISAYGEGWALYAEKLGVEADIYETPYHHFGRLTYEMWRACRLVIDTGIHSKNWTRQQAVDYLAGNTALSLREVNTEIDRYISWPGQALSYKLGEYTIWQLRREAEDKLGRAFDIRDFHDFILALGSVPLDILQDEVRGWITSEQEG